MADPTSSHEPCWTTPSPPLAATVSACTTLRHNSGSGPTSGPAAAPPSTARVRSVTQTAVKPPLAASSRAVPLLHNPYAQTTTKQPSKGKSLMNHHQPPIHNSSHAVSASSSTTAAGPSSGAVAPSSTRAGAAAAPFSSRQPSQPQRQPQQPYKPLLVNKYQQTSKLVPRRRNKPATRILRPHERQLEPNDEPVELSRRLHTFDRFFAALLLSSPSDYQASMSSGGGPGNNGNHSSLWKTLCTRAGVEVPSQAVEAVYSTINEHCNVRAALVLEEARSAVAQSLQGQRSNIRRVDMPVQARHHYTNRLLSDGGFVASSTQLTFAKRPAPLTKDELFHLRPATVFLCRPRHVPRHLLGACHLAVMGSANRERMEASRSFTLHFFRGHEQLVVGSAGASDKEWMVTPLTTLITELRQFEALAALPNQPGGSGLVPSLLGTRFQQASKRRRQQQNKKKKKPLPNAQDFFKPRKLPATKTVVVDNTDNSATADNRNAWFVLPRLNASQERAATTFLESPPNSITLVQGPPGTGKTTLLVSVICRYVLESASLAAAASSGQQQRNAADNGYAEQYPRRGQPQRRLLVCAPTNKAISVLATRFLAAMKPQADGDLLCNPILVGDGDKLMADAGPHSKFSYTNDTQLRSIFCFSWMNHVLEDYRKIKHYFAPPLPGQPSVRNYWTHKEDLYSSAVRLEKKLVNSLWGLPPDIIQLAQKISASLDSFQRGGAAHGIVENLERLLKVLKEMQPDFIWKQLLSSANVIFCTLASAGGLLFKSTQRVHDLIVDEAAAATEPELYIPLHLGPNRLLAVGDPLQLPATVLSRRAIELGLAKSLHERLMYECGADHIMLNVQYRMKPEISLFPSSRFYNCEIANGENVQSPQYGFGEPRLLGGHPYIFLQVDGVEEQGAGGSFKNMPEARAVVDLVNQLRRLSPSTNQMSSAWHSVGRIRIITFYQAQVGLLKFLLRQQGLGDKIVVATVDSSQGCEADIVIVSFVRSHAKRSQNAVMETRNTAGFLTDNRRMNVALTRAKYQLICIGNVRGMAHMVDADTLKLLAANAEERQVVRPYPTMRNSVNSQLDLFYGEPEAKRPKVGGRVA